MPEGPEVRTMVNGLQKYKNSSLESIKILSGRYKKHCGPNRMKEFLKTLPDKIESINNKGKFIWIEMKSGWSIWITLGMTGYFVNRKMKHAHIKFETSKGIFYMRDMRNFGCISFCDNKECLKSKLNKLGPDLIVEKIPKDYLYKKIKGTKSKKIIGEYLLDQSVLSGVGNYIRADVMYLAKINPFKSIQEITEEEANRIQKAVKTILLKNYKCKYGKNGCKFVIYGMDVSPLGEEVFRTKHKGRSIYWVPTYQL